MATIDTTDTSERQLSLESLTYILSKIKDLIPTDSKNIPTDYIKSITNTNNVLTITNSKGNTSTIDTIANSTYANKAQHDLHGLQIDLGYWKKNESFVPDSAVNGDDNSEANLATWLDRFANKIKKLQGTDIYADATPISLLALKNQIDSLKLNNDNGNKIYCVASQEELATRADIPSDSIVCVPISLELIGQGIPTTQTIAFYLVAEKVYQYETLDKYSCVKGTDGSKTVYYKLIPSSILDIRWFGLNNSKFGYCNLKEALENATQYITSLMSAPNMLMTPFTIFLPQGGYNITEPLTLYPYLYQLSCDNVFLHTPLSYSPVVEPYPVLKDTAFITLSVDTNRDASIKTPRICLKGLTISAGNEGQEYFRPEIGLKIEGKTDISHLKIEGCEINGFSKGITFGNNAYCINFQNTNITECNTAIHYPAGLTNSGERLSFNNCTIHNNDIALKIDGINTDMYFNDCSFDYNDQDTILNEENAIYFNHCHHEWNSISDVAHWENNTKAGTLSFTNCQFVPLKGTKSKYAFLNNATKLYGGIRLDGISFWGDMESSYDYLISGGTYSVKNSILQNEPVLIPPVASVKIPSYVTDFWEVKSPTRTPVTIVKDTTNNRNLLQIVSKSLPETSPYTLKFFVPLTSDIKAGVFRCTLSAVQSTITKITIHLGIWLRTTNYTENNSTHYYEPTTSWKFYEQGSAEISTTSMPQTFSSAIKPNITGTDLPNVNTNSLYLGGYLEVTHNNDVGLRFSEFNITTY